MADPDTKQIHPQCRTSLHQYHACINCSKVTRRSSIGFSYLSSFPNESLAVWDYTLLLISSHGISFPVDYTLSCETNQLKELHLRTTKIMSTSTNKLDYNALTISTRTTLVWLHRPSSIHAVVPLLLVLCATFSHTFYFASAAEPGCLVHPCMQIMSINTIEWIHEPLPCKVRRSPMRDPRFRRSSLLTVLASKL